MATIETLSIPNFSENNIVAEAEFNADMSAASNTATLLNTAKIATNDYVVLNPARATGELLQVQSITGENFTFTPNSTMQHRKGERVIKLYGNQIKIYKIADINGLPPDPTVNTYSNVGTLTIDPTTGDSYFTDATGGSGYWYIFTYYNQQTGAESDKSLSEIVRGGGYNNICSLEEIKDEAGIPDVSRLPNWKISIRRAEAQDEVNGALASAGYLLPLQTGTGVPYVPAKIKGLTIRLAAGLVLQKNFGITRPDSAKNGQAKIDEVRKEIAMIQLNDIVLVDSNGVMLAKPNLVSGWPDNTTDATAPGSQVATIGPIVTMDRVF